MKLEDIVAKFVEKPYKIIMGAPKLAKTWGVDEKLVYEARSIAKSILNEKEVSMSNVDIPDVATNKGSLRSRWFNGKTWCESYRFPKTDEDDKLDIENILTNVFAQSKLKKEKVICTNNDIKSIYSMNVYPSDQHIGASVENALYPNHFSSIEYMQRMIDTYIGIKNKSQLYGGFNTLSITFLGDTFDGQDGFTVKRTHKLPQNMSNAECFEVGLNTNRYFLDSIFKSGFADNYKVYFVCESNHGGDMDLYLFKALKLWIETSYPEVEVVIASKFIDYFTVGKHTFIYTHGKDNLDMKHGLPLNLDSKTTDFIKQYIDYYNLKGFIHFIKGDLHQNSLNNGKGFSYRNVPSLFGSSKWIMANYGMTEPGVGYDIFDMEKAEYITGVIDL